MMGTLVNLPSRHNRVNWSVTDLPSTEGSHPGHENLHMQNRKYTLVSLQPRKTSLLGPAQLTRWMQSSC